MSRRNSHPIEELELMAYLDGELPRERAAAAVAHLDRCTECQTIAADLRRVSQELVAWQIEPSDLQINSSIEAALEDHQRAQESSPQKHRALPRFVPRVRKLWLWSVPAVTVILILVATFSVQRAPERPGDRSKAQQMTVPEAPPQLSKVPPTADSVARETTSQADRNRTLRKHLASPQPKGSLGYLEIPTGPMVVRTAELGINTKDFEQARSKLEEILKRHQGYLGDLNVSGSAESARTLTATLQVPADQLDSTIAELKKLGRVMSESQKGEEVSQQYVDLQARLANARNAEQRLTSLLGRAGELSDVLQVEESIERVRENIERMEAEKKNLEKQVAYSTLSMTLTEDYKQVHVVPDSTSARIRNAAVDGYETMAAGLIGLLLFLASAGPSILLWGAILFFPARFAWKKWQQRNRI